MLYPRRINPTIEEDFGRGLTEEMEEAVFEADDVADDDSDDLEEIGMGKAMAMTGKAKAARKKRRKKYARDPKAKLVAKKRAKGAKAKMARKKRYRKLKQAGLTGVEGEKKRKAKTGGGRRRLRITASYDPMDTMRSVAEHLDDSAMDVEDVLSAFGSVYETACAYRDIMASIAEEYTSDEVPFVDIVESLHEIAECAEGTYGTIDEEDDFDIDDSEDVKAMAEDLLTFVEFVNDIADAVGFDIEEARRLPPKPRGLAGKIRLLKKGGKYKGKMEPEEEGRLPPKPRGLTGRARLLKKGGKYKGKMESEEENFEYDDIGVRRVSKIESMKIEELLGR
jgi:hypothetical protein